MKAQTEQLQQMSQTVEISGFSRRQSSAVIESVALAMQTFAVTPEVLDQRIDKVMDAIKEQGRDLRGDIEKRDDDIKDLRGDVKDLKKDMDELSKSARNYQLAFTLAILAAIIGSAFV